MSLRRPIAAIIAAIVLFLAYQWDRRHVERVSLVQQQEARALYVDPTKAIAIEFKNEHGDIRLTRDKPDSQWQIASPVQKPADDTIVNAFLENLRGARRQQTFPSTDLEKYGLAKPDRSVMVTVSDGSGTKTSGIIFGKQPGNLANVYAMAPGQDDVFTVSEWLYRQANKGLEELRDKKIFHAPIDRAQSMRIENRRSSFALVRKDPTSNEWTMKLGAKNTMPADHTIIDRLFLGLDSARFIHVEDNPTTSTAQLGLDSPSVRFSADGNMLVELGNPIPGREQFYARDSDGTIGVVSAVLFADMFRSPYEWGTKRFVWMPTASLVRIDIASAGSTTSLVNGKDGWRFEEMPDVAVRQDRMSKFLDGIRDMSARQFVIDKLDKASWIKYGILDESYAVTVTDGDGNTQGFRFGRTDTRGGVTYVLRTQDDSLWQMDFTGQKNVFLVRGDLIEQRIFPGLADRATGFDIETVSGRITFRKSGSTWSATFPGKPAVMMPGDKMIPFLDTVGAMEIQSELMGGKASGKPEMTIRLYDASGTEPFSTIGIISAGKETGRIDVDGRQIDVPLQQLQDVEGEVSRLAILTKMQTEKQKP